LLRAPLPLKVRYSLVAYRSRNSFDTQSLDEKKPPSSNAQIGG
jgi:hypothetical protein